MVTDIMVTPNTTTFMIDRDRAETLRLTEAEHLMLNEYIVHNCGFLSKRPPTWRVRPLFSIHCGYYAQRLNSPEKTLEDYISE